MPKDPVCGMEVSKNTPFTLQHEGKTVYFCSKRCMDKFASEYGSSQEHHAEAHCPACHPKGKSFLTNPIFLVASALALLVFLSYLLPFLAPFRRSLLMYLKMLWWAVALGLLIGGVIDAFIPKEYISFIMSKNRKRTIFYSVFLGFLMSTCSHGILAISMQLYKKGASTPAVVSFLLASPWANFTLTIMLFSFFGIKAFYIIFLTVVVALTTGFIFQMLESKNLVEQNPNTIDLGSDFSIIKDAQKRIGSYRFSLGQMTKDISNIVSGALSLADMVLWWILLGMGIASLSAAYIPHEMFHKFMGPTIGGIFVTLGFAVILEVCSAGTAPLAFEIYRQTRALGNSFVFLMGGVVTDYTEVGIVWTNIGRKTALWMLALTLPQTVILGILLNFLVR